ILVAACAAALAVVPNGTATRADAAAIRQDVSRPAPSAMRPVVVASKPFGESYLLAEMFAQLLESRGIAVERRPGLGATEVALAALQSGAIDVYPEYTGTGLLAVLHAPPVHDAAAAFDSVQRGFEQRWGIRWLPPLGFENTYAIAVRGGTAAQYGLRTLTDLARVAPMLRAGLTPDFIGRADGLPGLAHAYGLHFASVKPLNQALKYRALASDKVDVVDGYSTDGSIARYGLVVLDDDRHFFPPYQAAALVGARLQRDDPAAVAVLTELSGRLGAPAMRALNQRVEAGGEPIAAVAAAALASLGLTERSTAQTAASRAARESFGAYLWQRRGMLWKDTLRHLLLVAVPLAAGILVGLPLALWLERRRRAAEPVIRAVGLLQTIPSIALLAIMIPLLGVGVWPALAALWLYSLYPIVRSTFTAVRDADPSAVAAGRALGMTPAQVLRWVRTPLAAPGIMAGIRTAAVIDVGTATLAAFIGAGGLGDPIATGLALDDTRLILSGAIPAAVLALLVDALLAVVEWWTTPEPLRAAARERSHDR
ncbi:MAG TPA: glycine betaine ABC transporter substrate-binding protein, partial [Gemmatimonadaceae bacterium]|nr:glycine betaine ABC transporter substrate-binding protein [Gemmatimonadaceae bacterium]